ncbi:MAG: alpha/beta fold hydrolase [Salinivirgaceae bacterium]|nr:alpha/beta fold hydrolase [Salinivirgaceae bacterium]MDD4745966.1 alpha/beta fold hydrolase [Salinivirgaceae bacterium]MDY0279598.1 alpha/beta fold hydrolase [Salinivirgaceae bacterium]
MINLNYKEVGEGYPFIILHGLYGMSDNWISFAQQISATYKVYLLDLRNHGQSDHDASHTYADMVGDLLEFMDSHEIERAIILGHSMGGKVAMKFAMEYPERLSALIIADIAPIDYQLSGDSSQIDKHRTIIDSMLALPIETIASRKEAEIFLIERLGGSRTVQFLLKNIKRTGKGYRWRINLLVLREFLSEIAGGLDVESYNSITSFPVLLIRGAKSDYVQKEGKVALKRMFPMIKFVTIENAGHWLHADQPEIFVDSIKKFLD